MPDVVAVCQTVGVIRGFSTNWGRWARTP